MKTLPRIAVASTALAAVLTPAVPAAAIPPLQILLTVKCETLAHWGDNRVISCTVRNPNTVQITNWRVEFDLAATITTSWGARFTRSGDHVSATNEAWNAAVPPLGSTSFGFQTRGAGEPANCLVNGRNCDGTVRDDTDPTRPHPLVIDLDGGVTLRWSPSTDNLALRHYEVYEGGRLLATTSDTEYVYLTGTALPPRVYAFHVRAVDHAGNVSAASYASLGVAWSGETATAVRDLRLSTAGAGLQRLTWVAPAQPPWALAPLTAGFEVSLDGTVVGVTGSARFVAPVPPPGEHVWSVRHIDSLDHYSPPTELVQVVP